MINYIDANSVIFFLFSAQIFYTIIWEAILQVIEYIKYSKDKEKLSRILKDNSRMLIDREAALVIKTITNTAIEISEKEEKIDMCKAIDDMLSEREAKGEIRGIEIGEFRMLVKQVKKGQQVSLCDGVHIYSTHPVSVDGFLRCSYHLLM